MKSIPIEKIDEKIKFYEAELERVKIDAHRIDAAIAVLKELKNGKV